MIRADDHLIVSDMMSAMPSWDFARGPAGVRMLLETGAVHGVDRERLLAGSGLTGDEELVEAGEELQVVRNLLATVGDRPGLGVETGQRVSIPALGVWGFAVVTSATWGEALTLALQFAQLSSTFLAPEVGGDATELRIVLSDAELPADVRDFLTERDLGAIGALIPAIAGAAPPGRLQTRLDGVRADALRAAAPPGVSVEAGCPNNVLATELALLATPLPAADEATRRACERACEELLDSRRVRTGTAARVRARLLERPAAMPSMAVVADGLHVDVRTLRRRLAAEGTSYRALRDEVGETLAVELLQTVGLPVGEVAGRLGYSDATAFTHAFTRWTGRPPSAYRR